MFKSIGKEKLPAKVEFKPISVTLYSMEAVEMILVFKRKKEERTEPVSMTRSVKASDIKTMNFKNSPLFVSDVNWFVKDQIPLPKMAELTLITVDEETEK